MRSIKDILKIYQEGNKNNFPIIFVHGFPYDHTMWARVIEKLKNNYFCVTYDIRGLGESEVGDGQYTIEAFVDDLKLIIDELELDKPIICGLSMGGYITFRALERMEKEFRAAVICDSKPSADNDEIKLKRAESIKKIDEEGLNAFVSEFIKNTFAEKSLETMKDTFNDIVERSSKFDPRGVKGCLLAMASRKDTEAFLPKIKIPTLLLCGEFDKSTTPQIMKDAADKIIGSEFYVVPDAAHMTPIENPGFISEKISEFLKKYFN